MNALFCILLTITCGVCNEVIIESSETKRFRSVVLDSQMTNSSVKLAVLNPKQKVAAANATKKYMNCELADDEMVFGVLPGMGYDDLRRIERSRVVHLDYTNCYYTEDRRYLIPDGLVVIPTKTTSYSDTSEVRESWTDVSSSSSVNVEAEVGVSACGASGAVAYNHDAQSSSSTQKKTKNVIIQTTFDLLMYTLILKPDLKLNPQLEARFRYIAEHIKIQFMLKEGYKQSMPYVDYLCECVIRDFGTHYVYHMQAGGKLEKLEFVKSESEMTEKEKEEMDEGKFKASAGEGAVGASVGVKFTTKSTETRSRESTMKTIKVNAKGGPPYSPDFEMSDWENGVLNALSIVNRRGRTLDNLISKETVTGFSDNIIFKLRERISAAIELYKERNTHKGCMDYNGPFFDPSANVHDAKYCNNPEKYFSFHGFFQICNNCPNSKRINIKNPLTNDYSCPRGTKKRILLRSAKVCDRECHHYEISDMDLDIKIYQKRCHHHCGTVTSYWCFAHQHNSHKSRRNGAKNIIFGGIYSMEKRMLNAITQRFTCPANYVTLPFADSSFICVSKIEKRPLVQFGGLYTCRWTNPYAGNTFGCPLGFNPFEGVEVDGCMTYTCLLPSRIAPKRQYPLKTLPYTQLDEASIKNMFRQNELLKMGELKENTAKGGWSKNIRNEWKMDSVEAKNFSEQFAEEYLHVFLKRMLLDSKK